MDCFIFPLEEVKNGLANRLLEYWGAADNQHREQEGGAVGGGSGRSARPLRNCKIRPDTLLVARGTFEPHYHRCYAGRMISASLSRQYRSLPQHAALHSEAFCTMSHVAVSADGWSHSETHIRPGWGERQRRYGRNVGEAKVDSRTSRIRTGV